MASALAIAHAAAAVPTSAFWRPSSSECVVSVEAAADLQFARNVSEVGVRTGLCFFVISFAGLVGSPVRGRAACAR